MGSTRIYNTAFTPPSYPSPTHNQPLPQPNAPLKRQYRPPPTLCHEKNAFHIPKYVIGVVTPGMWGTCAVVGCVCIG